MSASPSPTSRWHAPRLRRDEDDAREMKTSWMELFFDLALVVVVAQLAHHLLEHPSWHAAGVSAMQFAMLWFLWTGTVYYNDRFQTDDASYRLIMGAHAFAVVVMAATAGLGEQALPWFAGAYACGRLVTLGCYLRAARHNPEFRPAARHLVGGFALGNAAHWVAALVHPWWSLVGLAVELATVFSSFPSQRSLPRLTSSHLPERYGLFTIIVLGEALVGVVNALIGRGMNAAATDLAWALGGFASVFLLWWSYFDGIFGHRIREGIHWRFHWMYAHLPLLMGAAALGPGITLLVVDGSTTVFGCAIALTYLALGLLEWSRTEPAGRAGRIAISALMAGWGATVAAAAIPALPALAGSIVLGALSLAVLLRHPPAPHHHG